MLKKLLCALLALMLTAGCALAQTEVSGLTWESELPVEYADQFTVDFYEGGYALIQIVDGGAFLLVPEGMDAPDGLSADVCVLRKPIDRMYLAATSAMALIDAVDGLGSVRLSSVDKSGWYVENAVTAMEKGDILFGGKYSEPDYELMVSEGCDLAVESTMIYHSPKVKEMIELLGIPVLVDSSSRESHPLGRSEWMKLYGVLLDRVDEAEAAFEKQAAIVRDLEGFENTGKTVAFFFVNSEGSVVVRASSDYVPKMIELAGGKYIFDDISDPESNRSTVAITMEQFYAAALDADYLVYNATIDAPISSVDELLAKSDLFADFKAVKEGNVWCTGKYLYQATDSVGDQIADLHRMLTGETDGCTFLYKLS